MTGILCRKVAFIHIIQQWDEAIFPGTDSSFVGKSSSGGMENEIDQEIEMMEMEDQLEDQDNE